MKDKILAVVVSRNNSILLEHSIGSFFKYDPGFPCDFLIVDNESDDPRQIRLLEKLSKTCEIVKSKNDRVEASFDFGWRHGGEYKYYLFLHDDNVANSNNWAWVFVDRLRSGYSEEIIRDSHYKTYPIGRVGASTQFWRGYSSVLDYSVQCLFLKGVLEKCFHKDDIPQMFKYSDNDRCLVDRQCLVECGGVINLSLYKKLEQEEPDLFKEICDVLQNHLSYRDEGIPPYDLYPPDFFWNRLCLVSEFMSSIRSLMSGWRTVGLSGDGYLEQIHGYDEPWGHQYIHHYGSPNMKQFLANKFNTDPSEISKHLHEKPSLMKFDKVISNYIWSEK